MATLSQRTGTGHSPRKESKAAGMLYIAISVVVVLAVLFFAFISRKNEPSPAPMSNEQNSPNPDVAPPPGAPPAVNQ